MKTKNTVVKRSGEIQEYDQSKIEKLLKWATDGLDDVDISTILAHFSVVYVNNQTSTVSIHNNLVKASMDLVSEDAQNYEFVAGRLYNLALRKEVWGGINAPRLHDLIKNNTKRGYYSDEILKNYSRREINKINEFINHDLDFDLPYSAINQISSKYIFQDRDSKEKYETPQFVYALVAMILFMDEDPKTRLDWVKRAYYQYSQKIINLATPIFSKARTKDKSFASCALIEMDDTSKSIMATSALAHFATVNSYGLGINVSNIRNKGAKIRSGQTLHTGLQPYLRQVESVVAACHQNGIRGGAGTIFINWWHYEVEDAISLKDNLLTDELAVRKLDYALVSSRLLWERFMEKQDITLFNPKEVPELLESFGDYKKFKSLYEAAEKKKDIAKKVINSRKLIGTFVKQRSSTNRIYLYDIDNGNEQSPFIDKVKQSNLCVTGSQRAVTSKGLKTVKSLYESGESLVLFDGEKVVNATPMHLIEKDADVFRVTLENGMTHDVTSYHKLVKVNGSKTKLVQCKDLKVGDFIKIQSKQGIFNESGVFDIDTAFKDSLRYDNIPDYIWSANKQTQLAYISGLVGLLQPEDESFVKGVLGKPDTVIYCGTKFAENIQILLSNFGITSDIRHLESTSDFCSLTVGGSLEAKKIKEITFLGKEDVYCTTVDSDEHLWVCDGFVTSNCMEILQPTSPCEGLNDPNGLIGVCILSAINPLPLKTDKDWEESLEVAVRMLDNLISYQDYFDTAAERFAKNYRSLGIGIFNYAAYLASNGIKYNTHEAILESAKIAERLSYFAIKASVKLAKERGKFEWFDKTKWKYGQLPIDRYNEKIDEILGGNNLHYDWESLRGEVLGFGLRNATLVAYMPVESSSIATGCTSGIEPIKNAIVGKSSRVNSVTQVAPNYKEWKDSYVKAYDIKDNTLISNIYLAFNKFTCMGLSMNHFVSTTEFGGSIPASAMVKDVLHFIKNGGITMYYLNTNDNAADEDDFGCSSGGCKL